MAAVPFYGATGKFTWRMGAVVLGAQSVVVFLGALVARTLAAAQGDASSGTYLLVGSGLAVLCLLAAGLMRRPYGVTVGWLIQVATFLCGFVVPMMVIVGVIFLLLWVTCLWQGQRIDAIQAGRAVEAGH
jgi:high-affinity Fe2+/Pb2+ permease